MKMTIRDPRVQLAIVAACWLWAFIDSAIVDASSYSDLGLFGKISVIAGCVAFAAMMIEHMVIPVAIWIKKFLDV